MLHLSEPRANRRAAPHVKQLGSGCDARDRVLGRDGAARGGADDVHDRRRAALALAGEEPEGELVDADDDAREDGVPHAARVVAETLLVHGVGPHRFEADGGADHQQPQGASDVAVRSADVCIKRGGLARLGGSVALEEERLHQGIRNSADNAAGSDEKTVLGSGEQLGRDDRRPGAGQPHANSEQQAAADGAAKAHGSLGHSARFGELPGGHGVHDGLRNHAGADSRNEKLHDDH
mmetsp:Transcript_34061/g.105196  ORF Transcript_34061/g.105196 Transcript_34061/m.105196 type:complete len:236 (+) Transcript_34061:299-1006(+)